MAKAPHNPSIERVSNRLYRSATTNFERYVLRDLNHV